MINTARFNNIVAKYDISDIEKSLVLRYIENNSIKQSDFQFLTEYIGIFSPESSLMDEIKSLGAYTLEDLAVAFELLIPESDRIINGAFFTPSYIVDYIIKIISPTRNESIADVSCGCGAFLLGIIKYYMHKIQYVC